MPKDLIVALKRKPKTRRSGMTIRDLCAESGMDELSARRRIRGLMDEGRIEVLRVPYMDISGRTQLVPAYRLLRKGPNRK